MLGGIRFEENGYVDCAQLNKLFGEIGWDKAARRTLEEIAEMISRIYFWVAAWSGEELVGFARVCGDPYVVQVLDVITREGYRRRGIARRCM
jgi:predicted GNAT family acetyltransferase